MFENLRRYVRHTLRVLWKAPLTTATMIACIALGIGPGLAIFGIVDSVLFKSLPVTEPDHLVSLTRQTATETEFPYPFFDFAARSTTTLQATAAWSPARVSARMQDRSAPLNAELVSRNYFSTLSVPMTLGTGWQTPHDTQGVIVSHRYWTMAFGNDASVLGRAITVQGVPLSIIGVAGRDFFGMQVGTFADMWLPIDLAPVLRNRPDLLMSHTQWWANIVGRRRAGTSLEQSSHELDSLFKGYRRSVAGDNPSPDKLAAIERETVGVSDASRGVSRITKDRSRLLSWMSIVAVCTLLLVLSDLAAVLLGRLAQRGPEFATRLSLGATTRTLYAQIALEQAMLGTAGMLVGVVVWYWVSPFLPRLLFGPTFQLDLSSSWRLVAVAAAATLLSTLVLASLAIQWIARRDLMTLLGPSGFSGGVARGHTPQKWSHAVLFVQVTLSLALVLEASAFAKSFANLAGRDLGFESNNVVMARLDARNASLRPEALTELQQNLLQRARAWPGTKVASIAWTAPLDSSREIFDEIRMSTGGQPCTVKYVDLQVVERDYFAVLGIPFVSGGPPAQNATGGDSGSMRGGVNETFARRCAGTGSMLGRATDARGTPSVEVVGVVKNIQYHGLKEKTGSVLYVPADRWPSDRVPPLTLLVRTDKPLALLAGLIRSEVRQLNPEIGIGEITTMAAQIHELLAPERTLAQTTRFAMFLGLLLIGVGIYGSVSQRVTGGLSEYALRLALGARLRHVVWMCVRSLAVVLVVGAGVGYLVSLSLRGVTKSLLFGTIDEGAGTMLVSVLIVLVVGATAATLPLMRLRRFDLVRALRRD
jgi:macrolide transport system ATP-binding/permease protein